jgi:hypothetical protein
LFKNLRRNNTAAFNEMSESVLILNHPNFQYFQNLKLNTLRQTVVNVRIVTILVAAVDITVHATAVVVVAAVDTVAVAAVVVAAAVDTVAVAAVVVAAAVDTVAVAAVVVAAAVDTVAVAAVVVVAAVDTVAVAAAVETAAADTVVENLAVAATARAILTVVNHVVKITNQVKIQAKATKVARNPPAVTVTKAVATVVGKRTESLFF